MPNSNKEEAGFLSNLHTPGGAAYGSVRNLVKTSNLPVAKVRQILHSKPSSTKFTLATRKFEGTKTFARFKNEIRCMDLAYVDKLAKNTNGAKYLPVHQDVSGRTVEANGLNRKVSKRTVRTFFIMITKKLTQENAGRQGIRNCLGF